MSIEDIKQEIILLAKMHGANDEVTIGDFKDAESIEIEAEDLIVAYCEQHFYLINGFPTEKRKLIIDEDDIADYFCRERFQLYLDSLAIEKEDVADIWWYYNKSFWPDSVGTKDEFLDQIKEEIENGYYDFEL